MIIVGGVSLFFEMDFSGTPFGSAPTWTDITEDVLSSPQTPQSSEVTSGFGRQDWMGDITAGPISVTLLNNGKYTPQNSGSAYFPNVKYGTRAQIRWVIAGVSVVTAGGFVTDVTATPANGSYWTATINFSDIWGMFGNSSPLRGFLTEEILLDNPAFLYPLQEDEGATTFGDITAQQSPAVIVNSKYGAGVIDAGQTPNGNFIAGNLVSITNSTYGTWTNGTTTGSWLQFDGPALVAPYTLEVWVQPLTVPPAARAWVFGNISCGLSIDTTGKVNAGALSGAQSLASICDGNAHHLVATVDSTNITLYVDGVAQGTHATGFLASLPAQPFTLGELPSYTAQDPFSGAVAYPAAYSTALSSTRVLAHYNAGANAFQGERTDLHVGRILTYRANYGSVLDPGVGFVGSEDVTGETMATALSDTNSAEGGVLYPDGQQRVVMRSRAVTFNPAPVVTVDFAQNQVAVATTFRDDIQNVVNDVTVSRPNGADQRAFNQPSINQNGDYSQSITANVDTDAHALAIASWALAEGIQDQTGCPNLTFDLYALLARGNTSLVLSLIQLRPLDCIKLVNAPSQAPSATMQMVVQGGSFTISSEAISLELYTTPLPPSVVQINGDAAHGINGTAILAY